MTKKERANPKILHASRKRRIAAGAGLDVSDLNRLLKMQRQMSDMMRKMGRKSNVDAIRAMMGEMPGQEAGQDLGKSVDQDLVNQLSGLSGGGMSAHMRIPSKLKGLIRK